MNSILPLLKKKEARSILWPRGLEKGAVSPENLKKNGSCLQTYDRRERGKKLGVHTQLAVRDRKKKKKGGVDQLP